MSNDEQLAACIKTVVHPRIVPECGTTEGFYLWDKTVVPWGIIEENTV